MIFSAVSNCICTYLLHLFQTFPDGRYSFGRINRYVSQLSLDFVCGERDFRIASLMQVCQLDLRVSDHQGKKCLVHIPQGLPVNMTVLKHAGDLCSHSGTRGDLEFAPGPLCCLLKKGQAQPHPAGGSSREKGIRRLLKHVRAHSTSIVENLDREQILSTVLSHPDFHMAGSRCDGVLRDVQYVQRKIFHVKPIPTPVLLAEECKRRPPLAPPVCRPPRAG